MPTSVRERWESVTAWPLLALSVIFLIGYSVLILEPDAPSSTRMFWTVAIVLTWIAYVIDYVTRLMISRDRRGFVRHHVIDLLSVLIPVVRPMRLLKYLNDIPYFRSVGGSAFRARLIIRSSLAVVLFVYVASLAVLNVERGAPGANIETFGDSVWWACVTMATVGYGDFYPVTTEGRLLAVLLMIGGVIVAGVATATIVSALSDRLAQRRHDQGVDGSGPTPK